MLQFILRIFGAIFFIWLIRRLLVALLGASRKNQPTDNSTVAPNHMVKDPVCGMYMDSRLAVRLERKRENFYFCSEECKEKYLSHPGGADNAGSAPPA